MLSLITNELIALRRLCIRLELHYHPRNMIHNPHVTSPKLRREDQGIREPVQKRTNELDLFTLCMEECILLYIVLELYAVRLKKACC